MIRTLLAFIFQKCASQERIEIMEIEKSCVPNTGVIPRLQRAWGMIQLNEASCSSESSLSWLQMGLLGENEKL